MESKALALDASTLDMESKALALDASTLDMESKALALDASTLADGVQSFSFGRFNFGRWSPKL
jgi:hypothetical protein